MTMIMSEQEARALARAIELMRPTWQAAGITRALGTARMKANKWTVALAAINAAADDANRTPAVIPLDGKHWPMKTPTIPAPPHPQRQELTEEEREAAHRQYLAARAVLGHREPRCSCGRLKAEPSPGCGKHPLVVDASGGTR
jgi:hypothetical protein